MVKVASLADSTPARMPHVSIPRLVLLIAYLSQQVGAGLRGEWRGGGAVSWVAR